MMTGEVCVGWLLVLPLVVQTLPSNIGQTAEGLAKGEQWRSVPSTKEELPQHVHKVRTEDDTENHHRPLCPLKVNGEAGLGLDNLQSQGVFREYEIRFLEAVRKASWEAGDLEVFAMCPRDEHSAVMVALKLLAGYLVDPQGKYLVVMHLEKEEWAAGSKLWFQGTLEEHILPLIQHHHSLILVFYSTPSMGHHGSRLQVSGDGIPQEQVACVSVGTRYLVLRVDATVRSHNSKDIRLHLSLQMIRTADGFVLSDTETQQLLFGIDDKCMTKMKPALFMIVGKRGQPGASLPFATPSSSSKGGLSDINDQKKDEFLETLSKFSSLLLNSPGKATSTIHISLDPTNDSIGDLHPHLFNVTDSEALEWLVEAEEPLVFLFLPGSKFLLGIRDLQGKLVGTLLEKVTNKLYEVLEDLEEVLTSDDHIHTLKRLLYSCHGTFNISYLPTESETPMLGENQHRNLHSLMLLKALQTVRTYWQDRKKLSRQNRGAGIKPHCRLQELTINLKPYAEYKDVHFPEEININNCVGPCRFPQTTQSDYQAHVILLIQLQERKQTSLARPPCCVPVKYQEQWLMIVDENGLRLQLYPNMVAKECGCR